MFGHVIAQEKHPHILVNEQDKKNHPRQDHPPAMGQ